MFDWIFEQFRRWEKISTKIEEIRDSPEGSPKRTWEHVWKIVNDYVANYNEDKNYDNLKAGLIGTTGGKASGAAGFPKQPKSSPKKPPPKKESPITEQSETRYFAPPVSPPGSYDNRSLHRFSFKYSKLRKRSGNSNRAERSSQNLKQ